MVVGEYESDHVFLSAESSIHALRAFATTCFKRRVHADTSKNEDTWYGVLAHYDAK
jgi:hypothetical protein